MEQLQLAIEELNAQADPGERSRQVAQLHIAEIHQGVLPALGCDFLAALYRAISETENSGVWLAVEAGQVIGFLAGCSDLNRCYISILFRWGFRLSFLAAKPLLNPSTLKRSISLVLYPLHISRYSKKEKMQTSQGRKVRAELLALAVDGRYHRQGIARRLVSEFEKRLIQWGREEYTVTTTLTEIGSNAFYRSLGFTPTGTFRHHTIMLQSYSKRCSGEINPKIRTRE